MELQQIILLANPVSFSPEPAGQLAYPESEH
jgi:hypothetical protein